ncbi:type III polyketide synthase [Kineococcus aurantiacus]|uniref:Putative naringenin-chalcone synthase n=1 Tax=Kineococcus aurantiacus TaxID=37633 RepID=A0A7Y9DMS0_9ACTN|nr:type III polyketide synthase [Kineococcus aurantiacus]NYD23445.1 putative naringenin-chalcone synthase [Kineococcus aurantiacus]
MAVTVRSIEVAVPPTALDQRQVRDLFTAQPGLSRLGARLAAAAFNASGIERRHTVLPELAPGATAATAFLDPATGRILDPGTGVRNAVYAREADRLFVEAAGAALAGCAGVGPGDVTHVVTASCTGFHSPGPDYRIVRALGLQPSVQRTHVGFMGCYAAFPALRQATAICRADPEAVVLVAAAELCTLHVRVRDDQDTVVGASLFADGAAAAVVTGRDLGPAPALQLDDFATLLTPVGEEAMAWSIGDHGFEMVLGSYVPHIIDEHVESALTPLLARDASLRGTHRGVEHWAVHPGGRSILDKVETALGLTAEQMGPSRDVLRDFGNMSSATVLFVLRDVLARAGAGERVCAMAFGPGLTVESGLFTRVGSPVTAAGTAPTAADLELSGAR